MTEKIGAYLGFCIRSGKIIYGIDEIEKQKKGVYLLLADGALSENSLKVVEKSRERLACPCLVTENGLLGELLHKPAVKAVALKDKNLSSAILSAAEKSSKLKFISGGKD